MIIDIEKWKKETAYLRRLFDRWESEAGQTFKQKILEQLQSAECNYSVDWENLEAEQNGKKIKWIEFEAVNEIKRKTLDATYSDKEIMKRNDTYGDLRGINFSKQELKNAHLSFCELDGANFSHCDLTGSDFLWVKAKYSYFNDSKLTNAVFVSAELDYANFNSASAEQSNFISAQLNNGYMQMANFDNSSLVGMSLKGTSIHHTSFINSDCKSIILNNASMSKCFLYGADFSYANLIGATIAENYLRTKTMTDRLNEVNANLLQKSKKVYNRIKLIPLYTLVTSLKFFVSYIEKSKNKKSNTYFRYVRMDENTFPAETILYRELRDDNFLDEFKERYTKLYIFWLVTSNCGRSISLVFVWSILISILFGLIYSNIECPSWLPSTLGTFFESLHPVYVGITSNDPWWKPFYMSFVTMTTLGWSSVEPSNLAAFFWHTIQNLLGYTWLGYLIAVLGNKLTRRSI